MAVLNFLVQNLEAYGVLAIRVHFLLLKKLSTFIQKREFFKKSALICVVVAGMSSASAIGGGFEDALNQLGAMWHEETRGDRKLPVSVLEPFNSNRDHWDDFVVRDPSSGGPGWSRVVMHYTVTNFKDSLGSFTADILDNGVSPHYLITQEETERNIQGGRVVQVVSEDFRAWHAGVSGWQGVNGVEIKGLNACSLGIEHVNQGWVPGDVPGSRRYFPYDAAQIESSLSLCHYLKEKYNIKNTCFVGHGDITERKQDPGPLFPWCAFFEKGIGAYLKPEEVAGITMPVWDLKEPLPQGKSVEFVLTNMQRYGYDLDPTQLLGSPKNKSLLRSFQNHFSQNLADMHFSCVELPDTDPKVTEKDGPWSLGLVSKYKHELSGT